jgi:DNA-binding NarL/FixJ family response regulator
VVVLTFTADEHELIEGVRAGAVGVLSKLLGPDAVVRALRGFHDGESLPITREIGLRLLALVRQGADVDDEARPRLTVREREVLLLVAGGARDRDIAERLVVSESTVKKHVQNILRKLQARNRAEAVAKWQSRGAV